MIFLKHKIAFLFILYSCFFFLGSIQAQSLLFPTDYLFDTQRQGEILKDDETAVHTSMQPFLYKEISTDTLKKIKPGAHKFSDKLFYESLLKLRYIDKSSGHDIKFNLDINPIVNFSGAKDVLDTTRNKIATNTRGVWIKGEIGNNIIFESAFMENQAFLPNYLRTYANATGIVPGQGRWKPFKTNGFDYAMASGVLNYRPGKNFSIRLGHGKQKVGNGYRSLLLSDNSFNYPYLQFIASFFKQKLQYSQTYALLMNLTTGGTKQPVGAEGIFQKKAASFQHLSWNVSRFLNVYCFQGMIWQATDSNNVMHLNPLYANPVMFSNLGKYGFNNANHILIGGGFEIKPFRKISIYGQFMYDGNYLTNTNYGFQSGLKLFNAFGIKKLFLQYEFNYVSTYSYQNPKYAAQDYTHYGQSLTTPALFPIEHIALISYSYKRVFIQLKENYSLGTNSGYTQFVNYFDGKIGYMINPKYNFNISAGITLRTYLNDVVSSKTQQMQLFSVSLRTSLYNLYNDF